VCRLLVRVHHLSSRRLLLDVSYSLYQHPSEIQCAIENIYDEYGLWTADTWAMSADAQLCDSGQWTPRDRRWQLWPCIHEVWTPHGEDRTLYCELYIAYLRPCKRMTTATTFRMCTRIFNLESLRRICVLGRLRRVWNLGRTSLDVYAFFGIGFGFGLGGVFLCCILGLSLPSLFFSFVNRLFGTWRIQGLHLFSLLFRPF